MKSLGGKAGKSGSGGALTKSKFEQMIAEAAQTYKIPHYGDMSNHSHFEVIKPCLVGNNYVAYQVRGEDNLDAFEATRRYNEFFMLRQTISSRWPGLYVPCIPPKKTVGNKEVKFIVERRYFLERFLK